MFTLHHINKQLAFYRTKNAPYKIAADRLRALCIGMEGGKFTRCTNLYTNPFPADTLLLSSYYGG